jgi:hypothetical protein
VTRPTLFLVAAAFGASIWVSEADPSPLHVLLTTLALLAMAVGIGMVLRDLGRRTPDSCEDFAEFRAGLREGIERAGR